MCSNRLNNTHQSFISLPSSDGFKRFGRSQDEAETRLMGWKTRPTCVLEYPCSSSKNRNLSGYRPAFNQTLNMTDELKPRKKKLAGIHRIIFFLSK